MKLFVLHEFMYSCSPSVQTCDLFALKNLLMNANDIADIFSPSLNAFCKTDGSAKCHSKWNKKQSKMKRKLIDSTQMLVLLGELTKLTKLMEIIEFTHNNLYFEINCRGQYKSNSYVMCI